MSCPPGERALPVLPVPQVPSTLALVRSAMEVYAGREPLSDDFAYAMPFVKSIQLLLLKLLAFRSDFMRSFST